MLAACLFLVTEGHTDAAAFDAASNDKTLKDMRHKITAADKRARKYEREANALDQEITGLRQYLVQAAGKIQQAESNINDKEDHLHLLNSQETDLAASLKSRHVQMAKTLAAMQRLSQQPIELVAYRPDKAVNSLRSASLLKTLQPELQKRAKIIRQDMSEILVVREKITLEREALAGLLAALTSEQIDMNELLMKRRSKQNDLRQATRQERQKLKQFAAKAETLQELIAKIEQEAAIREKAAIAAAKRLAEKPRNKTRPRTAGLKMDPRPKGLMNSRATFQAAKGTMPLPARGSIRRIFGVKTPEGQSSEGITIHTRPQATVISPHEGRVVFAGKFRSYGQLLIISHGPEYHTLLAGITRLDAEVGQWVLKGEPIGQMATSPTNINTANSSEQMSAGQNLYVELRRKGKPINPLPWIVASDRKVL
ncbi:MAG: peptidoglycan DD-metalloendopeptidase family protein [Emcibacter sp.]|nr:peptidoglycan DD-metalloendopeptidase family protein [Emcibacter sp.]